jgi:hypothetical protein
MMTDKPDKTADRLVAALDRVANAQEQGKTLRADIARALHQILERIRIALAGDKLRDLPNLGTGALPLYGVNLSGPHLPTMEQRPDPGNRDLGWCAVKIPFPDKERDSGPSQLVLTEDGKLWSVVATRRRAYVTTPQHSPWFEFHKQTPVDVSVHQLGRLVEILPVVLDRHLGALAQEEAEAREARKLGNVLDTAVKRFEKKGEA